MKFDIKRFYVYELCYPDGVVFYVGKGCKRRAWHHLKKSHNLKVQKILNKLKRLKQKPVVNIKFCNLDEKSAFIKEKKLILKYGLLSNGGSLVNIMTGGKGSAIISDDHRKKLSVKAKIQWANPAIRKKMIRNIRKANKTEEVKLRKSIAQKKKKWSDKPAWRKKLASANQGRSWEEQSGIKKASARRKKSLLQ